MAAAGITLFVERLPAWVAAVPRLRVPALESLVARGRKLPALPASPDRARMALLGADAAAPVPAGALTVAADSGRLHDGVWLRADPVTLRASMTQVYLAGAGMADLDADERQKIVEAVSVELEDQGFRLEAHHPERWVIPLERALEFDFTPLDEALGADVADHLPTDPAARNWKRLMNDLQVVLHNHPVNEARRLAGRAVVNGVWLWGDGPAPARPDALPFARVRSDQAISAGLARCFGLALETAPGAPAMPGGDGPMLVDWPEDSDPERALRRLDDWLAELLPRSGPADLHLYAGSGAGWTAPGPRWRRFWRPRRPLIESLGRRPTADGGADREGPAEAGSQRDAVHRDPMRTDGVKV